MTKWILTDTQGNEEVIFLPKGKYPFLHDHVVDVRSEEIEDDSDMV